MMTQSLPNPISQGPVQPDGSVDVYFEDGSSQVMPLSAVAQRGLPEYVPPASPGPATPEPAPPPTTVNLGGKLYDIQAPPPTPEQVVAAEAAARVDPGYVPAQNSAQQTLNVPAQSPEGAYQLPAQEGVVPPMLRADETSTRTGTTETTLRPGDPGGPPLPVPLFIQTPGGRGGVSSMGRLGAQELPQQSAFRLAAEAEAAKGRDALANGEYGAASAIFAGVDRANQMAIEQEQIQKAKSLAFDHYRDQLEEDAIEQSFERLDPDRIFTGEEGASNQIAAVLGMGFGSGTGILGKSLSGAIERDLLRQKSAMESNDRSRKTRYSALQMDIEKYGSEEAGLMKRRADMWDTVAHLSEGYRVAANGDKLRTDAEGIRDMALAKASEDRMKLALFMAQNTIHPSAPGVKFNPMKYAEFIRNGGDPKAFDENMKYAASVPGMDKNTAAAIALSGPAVSSDIRKAQMEAGLKEGEKISAIDQQTHQVGKMFQERGISQAESRMDRVEQMLSKYTVTGEDIPGAGPIRFWLGDSPWTSWMLTDEGKKVQQELFSMFNEYARATSGQAVTAIEMPRVMKAAFGPGITPDGVRQGMHQMRQQLEMTKRDILSSVNPKAAEIYMTRRATQMPGPSTQFNYTR